MIISIIYFCTVVITFIVKFLFECEASCYIKEHHLKRANPKSVTRNILDFFKNCLYCIIPIYNVFIALACLIGFFSEAYLEAAFQRLIDDGTFVSIE